MPGTKKVWRVDEWRAEFTRMKDKDQKKIYDAMQRLTREIFTAALVKHNSMDEAMMSLYLTGLYHATEVGRDKN